MNLNELMRLIENMVAIITWSIISLCRPLPLTPAVFKIAVTIPLNLFFPIVPFLNQCTRFVPSGLFPKLFKIYWRRVQFEDAA